MKVDPTQAHRLAQKQAENTSAVDKAGRANENPSVDSLHGRDEASFSERARMLAKSRAALEEVPEVRQEVVNELRARIENGNYQFPLEELARRLASRFRFE